MYFQKQNFTALTIFEDQTFMELHNLHFALNPEKPSAYFYFASLGIKLRETFRHNLETV